MNAFKRRASVDTIFAAALALVGAVYTFYFLVLPPDWTLRDDYSMVHDWTRPGTDVWAHGLSYLKGIMSSGRFQPVDVLNRILHFGYLPATPRVFRLTLFAMALAMLAALNGLLRQLGLSRAQRLLALLLVVSNLAFKEWLVHLVVSEGPALTLLMCALFLYSSGRRWLTLLPFSLSMCAKESFFLACGLFPLLELAGPGGRSVDEAKIRATPLRCWAAALAPVAGALTFVALVRQLPQGYTGGMSFLKLLNIGDVLKSFALPPLKSFGPALGLLALAVWRRQLPDKRERSLALMGLYLITGFTLFINAWGPFDSWFYLHLAIPFGWAFLIAALWRPERTRLETGLAVGVLFYSVAITINGSRNYVNYFADAKTAAETVCEQASPETAQILSNCHEGSWQLQVYLRDHGRCRKLTQINYLQGQAQLTPSTAPGETLLMLSTKCDPFDYATVAPESPGAPQTLGLWGAWRVVRARF